MCIWGHLLRDRVKRKRVLTKNFTFFFSRYEISGEVVLNPTLRKNKSAFLYKRRTAFFWRFSATVMYMSVISKFLLFFIVTDFM